MPFSLQTTERIKRFVVEWNVKNPVDYWWRQKYRISFGSETHLRQNFLNMQLEFEEDKLYREIEDRAKEEMYNGDMIVKNKRTGKQEFIKGEVDDVNRVKMNQK